MTLEEKIVRLDEIITYLTMNDVEEETIVKIEKAIEKDT